MLNKEVTVTIDRKIGETHPIHKDMIYPINYGYIEGIIAADGDFQDAYILGEDMPVDTFTGLVIAIIHRKNDVETKWVVAKRDSKYSIEDIKSATYFTEKYFDISIEI